MAGLGVPGAGPADSPYEPKRDLQEMVELQVSDIMLGRRRAHGDGRADDPVVGGYDPDLGIRSADAARDVAIDASAEARYEWKYAKRYFPGLPQHIDELHATWQAARDRRDRLIAIAQRKRAHGQALVAAADKYPQVQRKRGKLPPHPGDPEKPKKPKRSGSRVVTL